MRKKARYIALAAALLCAASLAGCAELEYHFGPLTFEQPISEAAPRRRIKKPRSVVQRVAARQEINPGSRIRGFCGQRHIRYHSGALKETDAEKARNDVLCKQAY